MIVKNNLILKSIVTIGFIGNCPYASGTLASIIAFLIYIPVNHYFHIFNILIFTFFLLILGLYTSHYYAKLNNLDDPSEVVIDELVGLWFAYLTFSIINHKTDILDMIIILIFFRFFDIIKKPFIHIVEKLPGGLGIMFDDIVAGIYACFFSWIMIYIITVLA